MSMTPNPPTPKPLPSKIVDIGDGQTVEFPGDMADDQVSHAVHQHFMDQSKVAADRMQKAATGPQAETWAGRHPYLREGLLGYRKAFGIPETDSPLTDIGHSLYKEATDPAEITKNLAIPGYPLFKAAYGLGKQLLSSGGEGLKQTLSPSSTGEERAHGVGELAGTAAQGVMLGRPGTTVGTAGRGLRAGARGTGLAMERTGQAMQTPVGEAITGGVAGYALGGEHGAAYGAAGGLLDYGVGGRVARQLGGAVEDAGQRLRVRGKPGVSAGRESIAPREVPPASVQAEVVRPQRPQLPATGRATPSDWRPPVVTPPPADASGITSVAEAERGLGRRPAGQPGAGQMFRYYKGSENPAMTNPDGTGSRLGRPEPSVREGQAAAIDLGTGEGKMQPVERPAESLKMTGGAAADQRGKAGTGRKPNGEGTIVGGGRGQAAGGARPGQRQEGIVPASTPVVSLERGTEAGRMTGQDRPMATTATTRQPLSPTAGVDSTAKAAAGNPATSALAQRIKSELGGLIKGEEGGIPRKSTYRPKTGLDKRLANLNQSLVKSGQALPTTPEPISPERPNTERGLVRERIADTQLGRPGMEKAKGAAKKLADKLGAAFRGPGGRSELVDITKGSNAFNSLRPHAERQGDGSLILNRDVYLYRGDDTRSLNKALNSPPRTSDSVSDAIDDKIIRGPSEKYAGLHLTTKEWSEIYGAGGPKQVKVPRGARIIKDPLDSSSVIVTHGLQPRAGRLGRLGATFTRLGKEESGELRLGRRSRQREEAGDLGSPVGNGWLTPEGRFISSNARLDHEQAAYRAGLDRGGKGDSVYERAYNNGNVRIVDLPRHIQGSGDIGLEAATASPSTVKTMRDALSRVVGDRGVTIEFGDESYREFPSVADADRWLRSQEGRSGGSAPTPPTPSLGSRVKSTLDRLAKEEAGGIPGPRKSRATSSPEERYITRRYGGPKDITDLDEEEPFGFIQKNGKVIGHRGGWESHEEVAAFALDAAKVPAPNYKDPSSLLPLGELAHRTGLIRLVNEIGADTPVEVHIKPTTEQIQAIASMVRKRGGAVIWDLYKGRDAESWSGSIGEFQRAIDKVYGGK